MDLHITTSSRLTQAEEEELRSNSGSTEQLQDPTPNDYPIKSAKLGSVTASPVIPAVVSPYFSVLSAPPSAATGLVKPRMLTPIAIVDKNQQQQSESQQGSPGRRSIDTGCKDTLQEEVRSQIQASASMDDDRDDLVDHSRQSTQMPTLIQRQQQQKPPIPIDKPPNDRKQHLSKPTSLSLPPSGITPTILVSASSSSPTVKLPSTLSSPRATATTTTSGNSNHGEKSNAVVLEPSKPVGKPTIQKDPRGPVYDTQLSSSGASVHSTSPTVISATSSTGGGGVLQQRKTSSLGSHTSLTTTLATGSSIQQHPSASSLALEAAGPPPATPPLDTQHFATVFHELTKSIEQLETLNDQILEKMTLYRPPPPPPAPAQQQAFIVLQPEQRSRSPSSTRCLPPSPQHSQSPASTTPLGTPPHPSAHHYQTHLPAPATTATTGGNNDNDNDEWRRILKGKARAVNLEEDRQSIAQSFTDLVMDSWPRIYKIPPEPWRTPQMRQDRIKTATRLKDAIVTFWSIQSYFQERAELILDVQQNPAELENGNRFRILKAQHLDNLLSQEPLHSLEIKRILDQHRQQQDQLTALSEQLQNVWLGILLLLGDPDLTGKSTAGGKLRHHRRLHMDSMHQLFSTGGGSSSSGYSLDYRYSESGRGGGDGEGGEGSGRRGLLRLSRNKRLGLKVAVLMIFGAGMIAMALVVNTQ